MTDDAIFSFFEENRLPKVEKKPWMESGEYKFVRVTNDTLTEVIDACIASGLYALDTETTGLDLRVYNGETNAKIVGCCLSPDGKTGYYIPLRHKVGEEHNVSFSRWKEEMIRLVKSPARAIFHNGKFDQEILQFVGGAPIGEWDDPEKWEDTLILAYLRDSRARRKGLKFLADQDLGMQMIELDDLFTTDQKKAKGGGYMDFSSLDPGWDPVIWYGCSDAICTYKLFQKLAPEALDPIGDIPSQRTVYRIEKMCVPATRWMERNMVLMDQDKAKELIRLGLQEWLDSMNDVYRSSSEILGRDIRPGYYRLMSGDVEPKHPSVFDPNTVSPFYMDRVRQARADAAKLQLDPMGADGKILTNPKMAKGLKPQPSKENPNPKPGKDEIVQFPIVYDILSPEKLGLLLRELNVPGLVATAKSGQVATDQEEIDRVLDDAEDQFPFAGKIKRFREVAKALSTYLYPIIEDCDHNGALRANFEAFRTDTGRFSAPSSDDHEKDGGTRFPFHGTPATYDPKKPQCLSRIRECIIAPPDWFIVSPDLSGEELRIATNLSLEPKWLTEFFRCSNCDHRFNQGDGTCTPEPPPPFCPSCGSDKIGDLHTITAIASYGADAPSRPDWKNLRQNGKLANFSLIYKGSGNAVCAVLKCPKEEGYRIASTFTSTYTDLVSWWDQCIKFGRKYKMIVTCMGRRYPLPDIDNPMGGFRAKAERNAVNGNVQGLASDMIKLAMGMIYNECKKRGWLHLVQMILTVHDELVFRIHKSVLAEAIDVIVPLMTRNKILLKLNFRVPFTSDIELGHDWTVPWNLAKMRAGKQPWPEELMGLFPDQDKKLYVKAEKKDAKPVESPSAPRNPDTYTVVKFSLGEVEAMAQYILAHGMPSTILGPDGSDLTVLFSSICQEE